MTVVEKLVNAPASTVDELCCIAAKKSSSSDELGRLDERVAHCLRTSGVAQAFVPVDLGGSSATVTSLTQDIQQIGLNCAATAWCASIFAYNGRFAGFFPRRGQSDIWAQDARALIASSLIPTGVARLRDDGDYELSGSWKYLSGIEIADWVLLAARVQTPESPPALHLFAVPVSQVEVNRTWNALGMRATGSHSVAIDSITVPAHRVVSHAEVVSGNPSSESPNGYVHTTPLTGLGGLAFLVPALGAASDLLDRLVEASKQKSGPREPVPDSVAALLGRASAAIDACGLLLAAITTDIDNGRGRFNAPLNRQRSSYAASLLKDAAGSLMPVIGTGGLGESSIVQRCWRDLTVATSHAALDLTKATIAYAETM